MRTVHQHMHVARYSQPMIRDCTPVSTSARARSVVRINVAGGQLAVLAREVPTPEYEAEILGIHLVVLAVLLDKVQMEQ